MLIPSGSLDTDDDVEYSVMIVDAAENVLTDCGTSTGHSNNINCNGASGELIKFSFAQSQGGGSNNQRLCGVFIVTDAGPPTCEVTSILVAPSTTSINYTIGSGPLAFSWPTYTNEPNCAGVSESINQSSSITAGVEDLWLTHEETDTTPSIINTSDLAHVGTHTVTYSAYWASDAAIFSDPFDISFNLLDPCLSTSVID